MSNRRRKQLERKQLNQGYSLFFEYILEICEFLIMNGHNTEYRNPYQYPLKRLFFINNTVSNINDKERALNANVNLTTNIASSGMGGKKGVKNFNSMLEKLNGGK